MFVPGPNFYKGRSRGNGGNRWTCANTSTARFNHETSIFEYYMFNACICTHGDTLMMIKNKSKTYYICMLMLNNVYWKL